MNDYETVIPDRAEIAATARALLAVADHPVQVLTHKGGTEFSVPAHVAQRYRESLAPKPRGRSKKEA